MFLAKWNSLQRIAFCSENGYDKALKLRRALSLLGATNSPQILIIFYKVVCMQQISFLCLLNNMEINLDFKGVAPVKRSHLFTSAGS